MVDGGYMTTPAISSAPRSELASVWQYGLEARRRVEASAAGPLERLAAALTASTSPEAVTPPDRIDGIVKNAAGTVDTARNIDVLADAAEVRAHRIDLLA